MSSGVHDALSPQHPRTLYWPPMTSKKTPSEENARSRGMARNDTERPATGMRLPPEPATVTGVTSTASTRPVAHPAHPNVASGSSAVIGFTASLLCMQC